jgi:hypothetical protein
MRTENATISRAVRRCTRCESPKATGGFSYCQTCRKLTAAGIRVWRKAQREAGLCVYCVEEKKIGTYAWGNPNWLGKREYTACEYHLEYNRVWKSENYQYKRAHGLCSWGGCQNRTPATLCETHLAKAQKAYKRRMQRAQRLAA